MADKIAASQENNEGVTEDGIEDAFEVCVPFCFCQPVDYGILNPYLLPVIHS